MGLNSTATCDRCPTKTDMVPHETRNELIYPDNWSVIAVSLKTKPNNRGSRLAKGFLLCPNCSHALGITALDELPDGELAIAEKTLAERLLDIIIEIIKKEKEGK